MLVDEERQVDWVREINPPTPVWVQLRKLLPLGVGPFTRRPAGLFLDSEVPGYLYDWFPRVDGGWLGLVAMPIEIQDDNIKSAPTAPPPSFDFTLLVPEQFVRRRKRLGRDRHDPGRRKYG